MVSYAGLVVLRLLSHPIKFRFPPSPPQIEMDWPFDPEARGREGSLSKPDNIS